MTRSARIAFILLALAGIGGLYVVQQLRHSDPVVMSVRRTATFSPTGSGPTSAVLSFWLKRNDTVAVSVVDSRGDEVRQLAAARFVPARTRAPFEWDGKDADGKIAPDGWYRFRIGLERQGRSLTVPNGIRLDTKPAWPVITGTVPAHGAGPLILPGAKTVTGTIAGTRGHDIEGFVLRTDTVPSKVVKRFPLPDAARSLTWDGRIYGHAAPEGVYLLGVAETDAAGNRGTAPAVLSPVAGPPRGRPGVTVRRLGVEAPAGALRPGAVGRVAVDARGHAFQWALRPLAGGKVLNRGKSRGRSLRFRVPASARGVLGLTVAAGAHRVTVPVAIDSGKRSLVVVLPAIRWQGTAPVDGDGDGLPDLLALGRPASVDRLMPAIPSGLAGVRDKVLPLLRVLAAAGIAVDATTDIALAHSTGLAKPTGRGLVFAGEETWLPAATLKALKERVVAGGRILDLGLDSMRRTVQLQAAVLSKPSSPAAVSAFGGTPEPRSTGARWLLEWKDDLGLFKTTGGRIFAPPGSIGTAAVRKPGQVASAAGPQAGVPSLAAWRLGRGAYIRPGLPNIAANALAGPTTLAFLQRALQVTAGH